MAYSENLQTISLNADSSLAVYTGVPSIPGAPATNYGHQYTFVKVTGANQVGQAVASTDNVVGVMTNKPQVAGQAATVGFSGVSNVMAGAAVNAGDLITVDASGRGISGGTAANAVGVALTAAGGANQLFSCLLRCY